MCFSSFFSSPLGFSFSSLKKLVLRLAGAAAQGSLPVRAARAHGLSPFPSGRPFPLRLACAMPTACFSPLAMCHRTGRVGWREVGTG